MNRRTIENCLLESCPRVVIRYKQEKESN